MERPSTSRPRGVCRFYTTTRGCREGDRCKFLHGAGETLTPYDKAKTCKFFAAGYCTRGASCWFRHDRVDTQLGSVAESTQEIEDDTCSVCYEKPTTYGLLIGCNHVFCIKCIRDWRDRSQKSEEVIGSGNIKRCPLCRQDSPFVVPSSVFYSEGADKQRMVEQYKASMARVACRHFVESGRKYCPFGRDCFYQHLKEDGAPHQLPYGIANPPRRPGYGRQFPRSFFGGFNFPFNPSLFLGELPPPPRAVDPIFDDPMQELSVMVDELQVRARTGRPPAQAGGEWGDRNTNPLLPGLTRAEVHNLADRLLAAIHRVNDRPREPSPAAAESSNSDAESDVLPALEPVSPPRARSPQTIRGFSSWEEPPATVLRAGHVGRHHHEDHPTPALMPIDPPPTRYVAQTRAPTPIRFSTVVPRRANPLGPSPLRDSAATAARTSPAIDGSSGSPPTPVTAAYWSTESRPPQRHRDAASGSVGAETPGVIVVSDSEEGSEGEEASDGMPTLMSNSDDEDEEDIAVAAPRTAHVHEPVSDFRRVIMQAREAVQRAEQVQLRARAVLDRDRSDGATRVSSRRRLPRGHPRP